MLTIDHEPDCEPTVFLMDMRAQGKGFDAFYQRVPSIVDRFIHGKDESVSLIGIDEETAIVGGPQTWRVEGRGSAWRLDGDRVEFPTGTTLSL